MSTSSAEIIVVQAIHKCSQKCLTQYVRQLGSFGPIPVIQLPFCSSCVALQCHTTHGHLQAIGHWTVEELFYLLVFVWSSGNERWPALVSLKLATL